MSDAPHSTQITRPSLCILTVFAILFSFASEGSGAGQLEQDQLDQANSTCGTRWEPNPVQSADCPETFGFLDQLCSDSGDPLITLNFKSRSGEIAKINHFGIRQDDLDASNKDKSEVTEFVVLNNETSQYPQEFSIRVNSPSGVTKKNIPDILKTYESCRESNSIKIYFPSITDSKGIYEFLFLLNNKVLRPSAVRIKVGRHGASIYMLPKGFESSISDTESGISIQLEQKFQDLSIRRKENLKQLKGRLDAILDHRCVIGILERTRRIDQIRSEDWIRDGINIMDPRAVFLLKILENIVARKTTINGRSLGEFVNQICVVQHNRIHAIVSHEFIQEAKMWLNCEGRKAHRTHQRLLDTAPPCSKLGRNFREKKFLRSFQVVVAGSNPRIESSMRDKEERSFVDIDIDNINPCWDAIGLIGHAIDITVLKAFPFLRGFFRTHNADQDNLDDSPPDCL